MIRGTTPKLTFEAPFEISTCKQIWITFAQNDKEVFTIEKKDCTFNGNEVSVKLTQQQTLMLTGATYVQMQIRVSFDGADGDEVLASDIITAAVQVILKDGEI